MRLPMASWGQHPVQLSPAFSGTWNRATVSRNRLTYCASVAALNAKQKKSKRLDCDCEARLAVTRRAVKTRLLLARCIALGANTADKGVTKGSHGLHGFRSLVRPWHVTRCDLDAHKLWWDIECDVGCAMIKWQATTFVEMWRLQLRPEPS